MRTHLAGADLSEATLEGARDLTVEQLAAVKTLYKSKLDPELADQMQATCPWLFEEPKPEPEDDELDECA